MDGRRLGQLLSSLVPDPVQTVMIPAAENTHPMISTSGSRHVRKLVTAHRDGYVRPLTRRAGNGRLRETAEQNRCRPSAAASCRGGAVDRGCLARYLDLLVSREPKLVSEFFALWREGPAACARGIPNPGEDESGDILG